VSAKQVEIFCKAGSDTTVVKVPGR
jgi:hypothetical protein